MAAYSAPQFLIIGVDIKKYIYKDEKKKKLRKERKKKNTTKMGGEDLKLSMNSSLILSQHI